MEGKPVDKQRRGGRKPRLRDQPATRNVAGIAVLIVFGIDRPAHHRTEAIGTDDKIDCLPRAVAKNQGCTAIAVQHIDDVPTQEIGFGRDTRCDGFKQVIPGDLRLGHTDGLGDTAILIEIDAFLRHHADTGNVLTSDQPENVQQIALTHQARSPAGKTVHRSLVDTNIVTGLLEHDASEETGERTADDCDTKLFHRPDLTARQPEPDIVRASA